MGKYPRRQSASESFFNEMASLPWWGSLGMGCFIWALTFVVGKLYPTNPIVHALPAFWPVIPVFFGSTAFVSIILQKRARIALKNTRTLQDLKAVPWQEFERLTAAYYEEIGYDVVHTGRAGPDGGYDLVLRKGGERILVQCKKHTREDVGVQTVREFFGVMIAQGAHRGIFITTSGFTPAAMAFGLGQATLELIPGDRFAQMVHHLLAGVLPLPGSTLQKATDQPDLAHPPCCPRCASHMLIKKAKRGLNQGKNFWGCPQFPKCGGARSMVSDATSSLS